jgi:hypothetical protein
VLNNGVLLQLVGYKFCGAIAISLPPSERTDIALSDSLEELLSQTVRYALDVSRS